VTFVTDHMITGGGGVRLHVREAGNPHGRPVLFIHGYSQSFLSWIGQLGARPLGGPLRLLAMDLRGHGLSDKPPGVYTDSGLWADDVQAVISTLELDRPVLVGWSYGGLVICDYLRFHPDTPLQGIEFVCPWTTLGTPAAQQEISPAVFALVPGLTSNTVGTAVAAVSDLIGLAFEKPLAAEPLFRTLGFNLVVPPNVRADLLDRTLDNDDVLAQLQVPVLVTQGAKDRILAPEASRQLAERIPGATLSVYPGAGHAPFVDNPGRFNRELLHFVLDG
jgi:non-heme chloroperoxidase